MMDIHITHTAYMPEYNSGVYTTEVKNVSQSSGLYSVSVNALLDKRAHGLPEMMIAWGFTFNQDEVSPLTETLIAACELIYNNLKENQHANV